MQLTFAFDARNIPLGKAREFADPTVVNEGLPVSAGVLKMSDKDGHRNAWPNPKPVGQAGYESTSPLWPMTGDGPLVFTRDADSPSGVVCEFMLRDPVTGGRLPWSAEMFPTGDPTLPVTGYDYLAMEIDGPEDAHAVLTVKQYDAGGELLATDSSDPVDLEDPYFRLEANWVPEEGCAGVELIVTVSLPSGTTVGGEVVTIQRLSHGEYADGDDDLAVWAGEPDRSMTLTGMRATGLSVVPLGAFEIPVLESGLHGLVFLRKPSGGSPGEVSFWAADEAEGVMFWAGTSFNTFPSLQASVTVSWEQYAPGDWETPVSTVIASQSGISLPEGHIFALALSAAPGADHASVWINAGDRIDMPVVDAISELPAVAPAWFGELGSVMMNVSHRLASIALFDDMEGAPTSFNFDTPGGGRFFTWASGPDGGSPITGYVVTTETGEQLVEVAMAEVPDGTESMAVQAVSSKGRSTPVEVI